MEHSYDMFAPFYRELISTSGHLKKELSTASKLLLRFDISKQACILDAACGTGDLLKYLIGQGFNNLSGIDSSIGMIYRANEILPNTPLINHKWEELHNCLKIQGKYDFIFILSVSLLHAPEKDIIRILSNLLGILSKNGILIFDNRKWAVIDNDQLIEPNRKTGEFRFLQTVEKNNQLFSIYDKCHYHLNRQIVTYKIEDNVQKTNIELPVSYLMKLTSDYMPLLSNIGFSFSSSLELDDWPYQLIYAIN